MIAAEVEPAMPDGQRRSGRAPVALDALTRDGFDRALCRVIDVSLHGCRLQTYSALRRRSLIWLTMPEIGARACRVMWADDFTAGCEFLEPLHLTEFKALIALDATLDRKDGQVGRNVR